MLSVLASSAGGRDVVSWFSPAQLVDVMWFVLASSAGGRDVVCSR